MHETDQAALENLKTIATRLSMRLYREPCSPALPHRLWTAISEPKRSSLADDLGDDEIVGLRRASAAAGGWIIANGTGSWDFVPMASWLAQRSETGEVAVCSACGGRGHFVRWRWLLGGLIVGFYFLRPACVLLDVDVPLNSPELWERVSFGDVKFHLGLGLGAIAMGIWRFRVLCESCGGSGQAFLGSAAVRAMRAGGGMNEPLE